MSTAPVATWVRPVPEPPPWTLIVAPAHSLAYALAAASTTGCMAVDPAAVMLPATQLTAAADPPADGARCRWGSAVSAVEGAVDAAVEGAVLPPLDEHAASAIVATTESAPIRRAIEMSRWSYPPDGHASGRAVSVRAFPSG